MAENVMLAKKWKEGMDPTGWWMSEKVDGIRAVWKRSQFWSRRDKVFSAPPSHRRYMPSMILDGELWLGRGLFRQCSGIIRTKKKEKIDWTGISYRIIDCPSLAGSFRRHYRFLQNASADFPSWVKLVRQVPCRSLAHLKEFQKRVLRQGGEGIMLRHPDSSYEFRRSPWLLKVKKWKYAKAIVVGYQPGTGKHKGRLGALICDWKGVEIFLGTGFTDKEREKPPKIGSTVVFRYFEVGETGSPRFPAYFPGRRNG